MYVIQKSYFKEESGSDPGTTQISRTHAATYFCFSGVTRFCIAVKD